MASPAVRFSKLTAGSLVCVDGFPVFHTYKNSFFSGKDKTIESLPFLVQFHPGTSIFLPLLYTKDLKIMDDAQVTDVQYTAGVWGDGRGREGSAQSMTTGLRCRAASSPQIGRQLFRTYVRMS